MIQPFAAFSESISAGSGPRKGNFPGELAVHMKKISPS